MKRAKRLLCLLVAVVTCLAIFSVVASADSSPAKLTNPSISPTHKSGMTYYGKYSGTVSNSSSFKVQWNSTETSFKLAIKVLNGEPDLNNFNDPGEDPIVNRMDGNRYTSKSYTLSKSEMSAAAGKWVKVYLGTDYWNCHYYFKVAGSSHSDLEDEAPGDMVDIPDKPTSVSAEALSTSQIEISWSAVSDATQYKVYRSQSSSSSSATLIWTGKGTSYVDSGLSAGTRYYYWVKASNSEGDSSFSARKYDRTGEVAELTSPDISPINVTTTSINGVESKVYYGKLSSAVACNNDGSFTVKWDNTDGSFRFAVKRLNGEPDISGLKAGEDVSESGTNILAYQTGRTTASYTISAKDISASDGKWIKVFVGGIGWNCHYYFKVTPKVTNTVSLSKTAATLDWGSGNEASVTVTASGTYSCEVKYDISSDAANYDYEWLNYYVSGNTLTVMPKRANYSASARVAYVTVTCGSANETLTVTQKACGEAEPFIEIKQGSSLSSLTTVASGTNWGNYSAEGTDMLYLYAGITNVRKITVNIRKAGDTYAIRSDLFTPSTITGDTACFVPVCDEDGNGLPAGEYQVDIWSSNSATENDYWAQKPEKITMYFSIRISGETSEEPDGTIESSKAGQDMADLALSLVGKHKSNLNPAWGAWCAPFVGYCARELDLIGADKVFAGGSFANPSSILKDGKAKIYYYYDKDKSYTQNYQGTDYTWNWTDWVSKNAAPGKDVEYFMEAFDKEFDQSRDYIPKPGDLVFFKCSPKNKDTPNAPWAHVGIITYYDKTSGNITFVDGNNTGNGSAGTSYGSNYVNKRISSLKNDILIMAIAHPYYSAEGESSHTHNYASGPYYSPEHPHRECMVCSCGDKSYTGNTGKVDGCKECAGTSQSCSHSWSVVGTNESGNTVKRCTKCGEEIVETNTKPGAGNYIIEVVFDAGTGSGAPKNISTQTGAVITIPVKEPVRSGYTFLGWATSSDAATAEYQAGDSYTVTEEVTFYAVWQKNSSSGGSGGGSSGGSSSKPKEEYVFSLVSSSASSATVSVTNNTGSRVTARLLIAVYDTNNRMIGCKLQEKNWSNGANAELTISYGNNASYVKVFVLDIDTNAPLFESWKETV